MRSRVLQGVVSRYAVARQAELPVQIRDCRLIASPDWVLSFPHEGFQMA